MTGFLCCSQFETMTVCSYVSASLQSAIRYQAVPWEHQNVSLTLHMPTYLCVYLPTTEIWLPKRLRGQSDRQHFLQSEAHFPCCFLCATDVSWVSGVLGHQCHFLIFDFWLRSSIQQMICFCYADDKNNSCLKTAYMEANFCWLFLDTWIFMTSNHTYHGLNKKQQTWRQIGAVLEFSGKLFSCIVV